MGYYSGRSKTKGKFLVSKASGVIQINNNHYDAVTGQLVKTVQKVAQQVKGPSQGLVDGFIRPTSEIHKQPVKKVSSAIKAAPTPAKVIKNRLKTSAQSVHQRAERSQTLMRSGVSKPHHAGDVGERVIDSPKKHHSSLKPARAQRAKTINQSSKVDRFGIPSSLHEEPADAQTTPKTSALKPVKFKATTPTPVKPLPSMVTSASHQHLERLLDQALTRADAHKKARYTELKNRSLWHRFKMMPRWISVSSSLAVVLLLGGFFAWQNVPQVAMRLAATRAHVNASVPGYVPSGFSFAAPIGYSSGVVSIKFNAAGDAARSFTLAQQRSNWDSSSLVANAIPKDAQVQTSQIKGTTVYIYGSANNAAWVNHGIRYTLTDKATLNSEQILRIADSL